MSLPQNDGCGGFIHFVRPRDAIIHDPLSNVGRALLEQSLQSPSANRQPDLLLSNIAQHSSLTSTLLSSVVSISYVLSTLSSHISFHQHVSHMAGVWRRAHTLWISAHEGGDAEQVSVQLDHIVGKIASNSCRT